MSAIEFPARIESVTRDHRGFDLVEIKAHVSRGMVGPESFVRPLTVTIGSTSADPLPAVEQAIRRDERIKVLRDWIACIEADPSAGTTDVALSMRSQMYRLEAEAKPKPATEATAAPARITIYPWGAAHGEPEWPWSLRGKEGGVDYIRLDLYDAKVSRVARLDGLLTAKQRAYEEQLAVAARARIEADAARSELAEAQRHSRKARPMSDDRKYVLLSIDDVHLIYGFLVGMQARGEDPLRRIRDRLQGETGGGFRDIADSLKRLEVCGACSLEGQSKYCSSLHAQKLGRRLLRLIERADGVVSDER